MAIETIGNFIRVTPDLATAGQPSEQQMREVAEQGFGVVVNLGLLDPSYCLPDEAGLVRALGLEYHHIPVNFQAPQLEDLRRFFDLMDTLAGKKVFVHCLFNKRVSSFLSLYGQAKLGWTPEKADSLIAQAWQPDEVWAPFIQSARQALELKGC
jgi:protein tyrosine phosphatase (PTP) superfamily phosphohydrolase (DUF442 family)